MMEPDADIEKAIEVIREGLIAFIGRAAPQELAEVAACVRSIEDGDADQMRRELFWALQQEAAKRR